MLRDTAHPALFKTIVALMQTCPPFAQSLHASARAGSERGPLPSHLDEVLAVELLLQAVQQRLAAAVETRGQLGLPVNPHEEAITAAVAHAVKTANEWRQVAGQ